MFGNGAVGFQNPRVRGGPFVGRGGPFVGRAGPLQGGFGRSRPPPPPPQQFPGPLVLHPGRQFRGDNGPVGFHHTHRRPGIPPRNPGMGSELDDQAKPPPASLDMTLDAATVCIVDGLLSDEGKERAAKAIRKAIDRALRPQNGSDDIIPSHVWGLLTHGLFQGKLFDHVYLGWRDLKNDRVPGKTLTPRNDYAERIAVLLNSHYNASKTGRNRKMRGEEIVAALIHQMIHAWFLVACGVNGKDADGRLEHGNHYWAILYEICEAAKHVHKDFQDDDINLSSFADTLIEMHGLFSPGDVSVPTVAKPDTNKETYCCRDGVRQLSKADVAAAYTKIKSAAATAVTRTLYAFDPDSGHVAEQPRNQHGSVLDYIEITWDGKNFPYPRGVVEAFDSLARAHFSDSRRRLPLPANVDVDAFRALHQFLFTRDYSPPAARDADPSQAGPPIILPDLIPATPFDLALAGAHPNPLLTSIKALKLSHALSFPELTAHALRRLNSTPHCTTSPLALLSEAYNPATNGAAGAVPAPLRAWCRAFMLAARDPAPTPGYYASNLAAMERVGAGVQGLCVAMGGGRAELAADYQACREALWARTPRAIDEPEAVIEGFVPEWWVEGGGGRKQRQGQAQAVHNNVFVQGGGDEGGMVWVEKGRARSPSPPPRRKSPGVMRHETPFMRDGVPFVVSDGGEFVMRDGVPVCLNPEHYEEGVRFVGRGRYIPGEKRKMVRFKMPMR